MNTTPEQIPVALFIRVSDARKQDHARQLTQLQKEVDRENYRVVATISEKGSGSRRTVAERAPLNELMALAKSGQIRKVLVTEFSRLGRRGREIRAVIEDLMELKVSVWSNRLNIETLLPTGKKNPMGVLVMFVYTERDEEEADLAGERIRSGIAHKRETTGWTPGRQLGAVQDHEQILAKYPKVVKRLQAAKPLPMRDIATLEGVNKETVVKVSKALRAKSDVDATSDA